MAPKNQSKDEKPKKRAGKRADKKRLQAKDKAVDNPSPPPLNQRNKAGQKHGHWETDGEYREYRDGKRHGHWKVRFADGRIQEGHYRDGKKEGYWETVKNDGTAYDNEFIDGKQQVKWQGRPANETKNGQKEGPWVEILADGKEKGEYKNGKKQGPWKIAYADGSIGEGTYKHDKKDGDWKTRHVDGSVETTYYSVQYDGKPQWSTTTLADGTTMEIRGPVPDKRRALRRLEFDALALDDYDALYGDEPGIPCIIDADYYGDETPKRSSETKRTSETKRSKKKRKATFVEWNATHNDVSLEEPEEAPTMNSPNTDAEALALAIEQHILYGSESLDPALAEDGPEVTEEEKKAAADKAAADKAAADEEARGIFCRRNTELYAGAFKRVTRRDA